MTKLSEPNERTLEVWSGVIDALLKYIQDQQVRALVAARLSDVMPYRGHTGEMGRAATALATFVNPSDD